MDYTRQARYSSSIMAALHEWNERERVFQSVFSKSDLNDKAFGNLKLAEYDRIIANHTSKISGPDDKAALKILRKKRNKLERSLYPLLISRLLRRAVNKLQPLIDEKNDAQLNKHGTDDNIMGSVKYYGKGKDQNNQQHSTQIPNGQDLGKRSPRSTHSNRPHF